MQEKILVIHGGGPTAVINGSLYGVLRASRASQKVAGVLGALGGVQGVLQEHFLSLLDQPESDIERLLTTPASAIGTSRYPLEEKDYVRMVNVCMEHRITCVLLNGGNGTMDTCGRLARTCEPCGIRVVGIPKTIDNDIAVTDHSLGFGSAARYIATTVREIGQDVKSLPIHVCIVEALGRNAGWITAASALAREGEGTAPHLIYLPERGFNEENFLRDVKILHEQHGGVVVVVSEGLRGKDGKPIVPPIFTTGRATYYGDVSAYLANRVIQKLGIKARSEKPGLAGRASIACQSEVDLKEAIRAGELAVEAVLAGKTGVMVGFSRLEGNRYQIEPMLIPISSVMLNEKKLPNAFIAEKGNDVTDAFVRWAIPLIGGPLPSFVSWI